MLNINRRPCQQDYAFEYNATVSLRTSSKRLIWGHRRGDVMTQYSTKRLQFSVKLYFFITQLHSIWQFSMLNFSVHSFIKDCIKRWYHDHDNRLHSLIGHRLQYCKSAAMDGLHIIAELVYTYCHLDKIMNWSKSAVGFNGGSKQWANNPQTNQISSISFMQSLMNECQRFCIGHTPDN
jgi:hypothetical protein